MKVITTLACAVCVACGSGGEYGDPPSGSGSQTSFTRTLRQSTPETILAIVDDTPAGAALRDQLASAFDELGAELSLTACSSAADPAAWHRVDRSAVIVHPSTAGSAGYSSPADDSGLRWQADLHSSDGQAAWTAAVRTALAAHPAEPGAPFGALAALDDSVALLYGFRTPATDAEQALLAALPARIDGPVTVALATEDQSPGMPSQYLNVDYTSGASDGGIGNGDIVVPAALPVPALPCADRSHAVTARYQQIWGPAQGWPCAGPQFFHPELAECQFACSPRPIAKVDGSAVCRATATYPGSEPCPTELGWLDPMNASGVRAPRVDHDASGDTRVCEVRQLDGAALASCRSTLDCTDCEPGWCATEVPELVPNDKYCPSGSESPPFRFVLGADHARDAELSIVCDEASSN